MHKIHVVQYTPMFTNSSFSKGLGGGRMYSGRLKYKVF